MNNGTARRFTDGATKDLMRNWSRASLAQEEELEKVGDGFSLVPVKIGVGDLAGFLLKRNQKRGNALATTGLVARNTRCLPMRSPVTSMFFSKSEASPRATSKKKIHSPGPSA